MLGEQGEVRPEFDPDPDLDQAELEAAERELVAIEADVERLEGVAESTQKDETGA